MSQERWVNVGKAIAILAVLIDHTKGYCYTDNYIQIASFFSVSLFILLMGVTTYWSFSKSKISLKMKVGGRILKIISAYALAVLCEWFYFCIRTNFWFGAKSSRIVVDDVCH